MKKLNFSPSNSLEINKRCLAIMEEDQEESTEINNNGGGLSNYCPASGSNIKKVLSIDLSMS